MIVYILLFVTALFGSNIDPNDFDKKSIPQHLSLDWSSFTKALSESAPEILKTLNKSLPNQFSNLNNKNNKIVPDNEKFSGLPQDAWNFIISQLNLNKLFFISTTFQEIVDQPTQYLKLRKGPNIDDISSLFRRFYNVKRIKLSRGLSESHANSIMSHLPLLTNIQELDLERCRNIKDTGLLHLSGLINIRKLNLDRCRNITDESLSYLSPLTNIRALNLSFCKEITDQGLAYLSQLINLQNIDLRGMS